jgi:hypothetical protein
MTLFFKNFDKGEARKSLAGDGPVYAGPPYLHAPIGPVSARLGSARQ